MGLKIGIMADSHGDAKLIEAAIAFLKAGGCSFIFHLGDICDSFHLQETAACIRLLQKNNVLAIKGNNDHVITRYHDSHDKLTLTSSQKSWLNHLPLVRDYRYGVFTHSLPFERELGLSCMVRPMEETQAGLFFRQFPGKTLFRGHSHIAEFITGNQQDNGIPLPVDAPVNLDRTGPCIITCGALMANLCAIWQPEDHLLTSLTF